MSAEFQTPPIRQRLEGVFERAAADWVSDFDVVAASSASPIKSRRCSSERRRAQAPRRISTARFAPSCRKVKSRSRTTYRLAEAFLDDGVGVLLRSPV